MRETLITLGAIAAGWGIGWLLAIGLPAWRARRG